MRTGTILSLTLTILLLSFISVCPPASAEEPPTQIGCCVGEKQVILITGDIHFDPENCFECDACKDACGGDEPGYNPACCEIVLVLDTICGNLVTYYSYEVVPDMYPGGCTLSTGYRKIGTLNCDDDPTFKYNYYSVSPNCLDIEDPDYDSLFDWMYCGAPTGCTCMVPAACLEEGISGINQINQFSNISIRMTGGTWLECNC